MKFLEMLDETELAKIQLIIVNACAEALNLFFFPPGDFKPEQMKIWTITENCVDRTFARYGFRSPSSNTAVLHNIDSENSARQKQATQKTALISLISEAKKIGEAYFGNKDSAFETALYNAIRTAEREFGL